MKKTIKYLENGEYKYPTVKDIGDIDLLKTNNKEDLVSAINDIMLNGTIGGVTQDQIDKLNTDISGVSSEIADKVLGLQESIKEHDLSQTEARSEAIKAINQAIADANKMIADYKKANDEAVKAVQQDIDEHNNRISEINDATDTLRTDLTTNQNDLKKTKSDLANAQLDLGKVHKDITNLDDKISSKLSQTDLDPLSQKVQSVETEVSQTKESIKQYVKHDEYDLTTGEVNKLKSSVKELDDRIQQKVSKDTLNDDVEAFTVKKANLFLQTRDWSNVNNSGWTFSDNALANVQGEIYNHCHVLEVTGTNVYAIQSVDNLSIGENYTISIDAKIKNNATVTLKVLTDNDARLGDMITVFNKDTNVTTDYQRFMLNFVATKAKMQFKIGATGIGNGQTLYIYRAKLEKGNKAYAWEQNEYDVYAKVAHNEASLNVYNDKIAGVVKKQEDFGNWQTQAQSTLTQTANGVQVNNQKLQGINGTVTSVIDSKIEASAERFKTDYQNYTNQAVGAIVDEGTNQILNSAFTQYDVDSNDIRKKTYTFASWQNISALVNIKAVGAVNYAHMKQSGLSQDNPISITSNNFSVKQGKVIIGVDIMTPNVSAIDNQKVIVVNMLDNSNKRVDYRELSLNDLGLNTLSPNTAKRGTYRVGIDRKDVVKMNILARLPRNGEIYFTNFYAKVSSLDNGDYQPNPSDLAQQSIRQQTSIDQTAGEIKLKADQTTVDSLKNTVTKQGTDIEQNSKNIALKAESSTVAQLQKDQTDLSQLVQQNKASINVNANGVTQQASRISSVTTTISGVSSVANSALSKANNAQNTADNAVSKANNANDKIDNLSIGGTNLLQGTSTDWKRTSNDGWAVTQFSETQVGNNKQFIFSVSARNVTGNTIDLEIQQKPNLPNINVSLNDVKGTHKVGNDEKRLTITFTVDDECTSIIPKIRSVSSTGKTVSYEYSKPKLEYGNIATAWDNDIDQITDLQNKTTPQQLIKTVTDSGQANHLITADSVNQSITGVRTEITKAKDELTGKLNTVETKVQQNTNETKSTKDKTERLISSLGADSNGNFSWANNSKIDTALGSYQTIKKIDGKIDGLQVGGRNLLTGTSNNWKTLTGRGWLNVTTSTNASRLVSTADYHTNDEFIYSMIITNTSGYDLKLEMLCVGKDKKRLTKSAHVDIPNGSLSRRVSTTLAITGDTYYIEYSIISTNGNAPDISFQVKGEMLAEGNKATDWSPSPEDIEGKINGVQNNLTQYKAEASTTYAKASTTYTKSDVDGIAKSVKEQTADSIKSEISKVSIGGTNLIKNSDLKRGKIDYNNADAHKNTTSEIYRYNGWDSLFTFARYSDQVNEVKATFTSSVANLGLCFKVDLSTLDLDSEYTMSAYMKANNTTNAMQLIIAYGKSNGTYVWAGGSWYTPVIKANEWCRYTRTFKFNTGYDFALIGFLKTGASGDVFEMRNPQLEKGNKATDWSPAPEDVAYKSQVLQKNDSWVLTIENTANTAKTKADIAQSTANTANSKAGTAQSTADSAKSLANTAQNGVNDLSKKVNVQNLTANTNLNNLTTTGTYFLKGGFSNGPESGGWCYVSVEDTGQSRRRQTWQYDQNPKRKYNRTYNGSSWGTWVREVSDQNILTTINASTEGVKIAGNKVQLTGKDIILDGNTRVNGDFRVSSANISSIDAGKITVGTLKGIAIDSAIFTSPESDPFDYYKDSTKGLKIQGGTLISNSKDTSVAIDSGSIVFASSTDYGNHANLVEISYNNTPNAPYTLNIGASKSGGYIKIPTSTQISNDYQMSFGNNINNERITVNEFGLRKNGDFRLRADSNVGLQGNIVFFDSADTKTRTFEYGGNNTTRYLNLNTQGNLLIGGMGGFIVNADSNFGNHWVGMGALSVSGSKNSTVPTSQGWTLINAYETAEYYFGDLGIANTGDTKKVKIVLDPIFKQTVNLQERYHVFITAYNKGNVWVSSRNSEYFVVESDVPNVEFSWEIKAKRLGYENHRLEIDRNHEKIKDVVGSV